MGLRQPAPVPDGVRPVVGFGVLPVVRHGARELARIWRGVVGEDAYERYREHVESCRASGEPDHPLMTEREFWRDRTDRQDARPQGRCC